jgi:hypothetical protein
VGNLPINNLVVDLFYSGATLQPHTVHFLLVPMSDTGADYAATAKSAPTNAIASSKVKVDVLSFVFYIGYLRVSNANSTCII